MGNNWKNSEKSKEDVENDILIINQITRNYLFMKLNYICFLVY